MFSTESSRFGAPFRGREIDGGVTALLRTLFDAGEAPSIQPARRLEMRAFDLPVRALGAGGAANFDFAPLTRLESASCRLDWRDEILGLSFSRNPRVAAFDAEKYPPE